MGFVAPVEVPTESEVDEVMSLETAGFVAPVEVPAESEVDEVTPLETAGFVAPVETPDVKVLVALQRFCSPGKSQPLQRKSTPLL